MDLFTVDADNNFIKICQFIRKENEWFFLKIKSEQPLSNTNLTFNKGIWRPVCKENVYWYLVGLVLKYELMCYLLSIFSLGVVFMILIFCYEKSLHEIDYKIHGLFPQINFFMLTANIR